PFESGGVADIYRGRLRTSQLPYLYTEARIWQQLQHPNILPFLGISLDLGLSPALISPLCESGPVMKYLHANKKDLQERIQLVIGISNGLEYLHSQGVIHGNL
ncbi:kinase-like domain-containing protein, partial [Mycena pura]